MVYQILMIVNVFLHELGLFILTDCFLMYGQSMPLPAKAQVCRRPLAFKLGVSMAMFLPKPRPYLAVYPPSTGKLAPVM